MSDGEGASRGAVSFIGAGRMGGALARTLIDGGWDVTMWNRDASRLDAYAALGATAAGSVLEAVQAGEVVVVCVLDYPASDSLLLDPEVTKALEGKTLIQMTTGTPAQGRAAGAWAAANGIAYLDAYPVVYDTQIGGDLSVLVYAGAAETFAAVRPELERFGKAVHLGESPGLANAALIGSVPLFHGAMLGFLQGGALIEAEGLDFAHYRDMMLAFVETIRETIEVHSDRIMTGEYDRPGTSIQNHTSVSSLVVEACADAGVSTAFPRHVDWWFEFARDDRFDGKDVSAMIELFRRPLPGE